MKVVREFRDSSYRVVEAEWEGNRFLYLEDFKEGTQSLCLLEKEVPLDFLWEKHKEDENFCLPCELLLFFERKVLKWRNSTAEMGLTLERLENFRKLLEVKGENS